MFPWAPLGRVALIPLAIETTTLLFTGLVLAQDRVRGMTITTAIQGAVNLSLGLALAGGLHWGLGGHQWRHRFSARAVLLPVYVARRLGVYMPNW